MSAFHIADTGLFVAMGQPSNSRYRAVRRFDRRNDITFILSERVYEEAGFRAVPAVSGHSAFPRWDGPTDETLEWANWQFCGPLEDTLTNLVTE